MDKRIYKPLIVLVLIVLIAGCTSSSENGDGGAPVVSSKTYGIRVADFSSLNEVYSNEPVDLGLTIQNVGDAIAENIRFELYQKSGFTGEDPGSLEKLLPPDPEMSIAGEKELVFWTLTAPSVESDRTKYLKGRITYDYVGRAGTNVHLVPAGVYQELGADSFSISSSSTDGPVTIDVVEIDPYRMPEAKEEQTVHLSIRIKNTGTGVVESFEADNDETYEIHDFNLKVVGPEEAGEFECNNVEEGNIKLFGTEQARSIKCTGNLPFDGSTVEYIFEINASYTYRIDTPTVGIKVLEEGWEGDEREEASSAGEEGGAVCGDGICDVGENVENCPSDCTGEIPLY